MTIQELKTQPRWVSWKQVSRDGKMTKVPVQLNGSLASSTDPLTWTTFEALGDLPKGIVFTPDKTLLGIDIDKCLVGNEIQHEQKENIERFIKEANTYTEVSPSGTGLHLLLWISCGLTLKANRKSPYECYTEGRYFTFTGKTYGTDNEIRRIDTQEEAERLLSIIGYPWGKDQITPPTAPTAIIHSHSMDDEKVLSKMFAAKNGAAVKAVYDGDTTKWNGDESLADASLLSHLAFWTGKNATQMEHLWLSSPLGSREKTQRREDYRKRSIDNAISKCGPVYEPIEKKIEMKGITFLSITKYSKSGEAMEIPHMNTENIARILRADVKYQGKLRYDTFRNAMEFNGKNGWALQDNIVAIIIQSQISIDYPAFSKVSKDMVRDAITLVSRECVFDSALEYLKGLTWDGAPRLNTWLCNTYGTPDDVYHQAVASNWLKGLVKRLVEPGCKFDYVLVLEGEQGTRKSTSLGVLGGSWHVETTMSTDTKDFFMQFQGKAIIEFSEGETLSKTEVKKMKAIITTQVDKFRPPYESLSQDFPRRCVFAMTTNQSEYLKDETGNRRWLPVALAKEEADIEWLEKNRDQLFAEAYHRVVILKESVHDFPKEETRKQQADRRIMDPMTEKICHWYLTSLTDSIREEGVTTMMAYEQVLDKNGLRNMNRYDEMIIATAFTEILGLNRIREMRNHTRKYTYMPNKDLEAKDLLDSVNW